MPTYVSSGLPAQSHRRMFTTVRCQGCGLVALATTDTELPRDQLDLAAMSDARTRVRGGTCPECGGSLEPETACACFWPDEPELPALCWEAPVTEGEAGKQSWFLFDHPAVVDGEDALLAGQALAEGAFRDELAEISEEVLVRQWGRPLSMRALIRLLVVEAIERGESGTAHHVAPGLSVAVFLDDAARPRNLTAVVASLVSQSDALQVNLLSEGADVPGGYREWLGPYADRLGRDLEVVVAVDLNEARGALTTALARLQLKAAEVGEDADLLRVTGGAVDSEVSLGHFAGLVAALGLTLAEAAADAALVKQTQIQVVAAVLPLVEDMLSPLEVEACSIYDVIVRSDNAEVSIDLAGLLDEVRGDVLSGEFERVLRGRCREFSAEAVGETTSEPSVRT